MNRSAPRQRQALSVADHEKKQWTGSLLYLLTQDRLGDSYLRLIDNTVKTLKLSRNTLSLNIDR